VKPAIVAWFATVGAFLVLDGLWLGLVAREFYASRLGSLMRKPVLITPIALFYLCYAAGLVFLAVRPYVPELSLGSVAVYGAIVGFLAYCTYDMTNLATVRGWPAIVSVVDLIWGTSRSAAVSVIAALAVRSYG